MPITPFSTPAQQNFIPLQDYTPVEMIGQVINKLDARQAQGLAAADRIDLLRDELSQSVLPEQQQFADEYLASANQQMSELAESGDYIDALPKLRRMASGMRQNFSKLNQNYSAVQARRKEIEDALMKDPNALTDVDIEEFLTAPRAALAGDPNAAFAAPTMMTRVNRFELLNDFFKDMDPDQEVEFRDRNGIIVKSTVKELTPEDIFQAGESILRNNPAIQREMARDFRAFSRNLGDNAAEQFAWSQWEDLEGKKAEIETDENLTPADKERLVAQVNSAQGSLDIDPEAAFRGSFIENQTLRDIQPFLNKSFRQESATLHTDPYRLEDYRQRNRLAREGIREARAARKEEANNSSALYTFSSAGRAPSPVPAGGNMTSTIQQADQTIEQLQSQLATASPEQAPQIQAQLDDVEMRRSLVDNLRQQAIQELGLDPEALEIIENGKPQVPSRVDASRLQELQRIGKSLPSQGGGGSVGIGRYGADIAKMLPSESEYVNEYEDWYKELTAAQKHMDKELDKYFNNWSKSGATSVPVRIMEGGQDNTRLKNFVNGPTGVKLYKGTPEDRKPVKEDDKVNITNIQRYTTIPLGTPEGDQAYRITGEGSDGEIYTAVVTDEDNFRDYLTRTEQEGLEINGSYFGMLLHGVADGLSINPKVRGTNPLGEGGTITRKGNNFVFKDANGKTKTLPMQQAIVLLEQERNGEIPE